MLVKVTLRAAWAGRPAGAEIEVDPVRAQQLRAAGLAESGEGKSKSVGRRAGRAKQRSGHK